MAKVEFKGKVEPIYSADAPDVVAYELIKVPTLERRHCDMAAFRRHPKIGGFANSDLFPAMLRRAAKAAGVDGHLRLDRIPAGVTVDRSGFLAKVTFDV